MAGNTERGSEAERTVKGHAELWRLSIAFIHFRHRPRRQAGVVHILHNADHLGGGYRAPPVADDNVLSQWIVAGEISPGQSLIDDDGRNRIGSVALTEDPAAEHRNSESQEILRSHDAVMRAHHRVPFVTGAALDLERIVLLGSAERESCGCADRLDAWNRSNPAHEFGKKSGLPRGGISNLGNGDKETQDIVSAETGPDLLQVVELCTMSPAPATSTIAIAISLTTSTLRNRPPEAGQRHGLLPSVVAEAAHRKCERGNKAGKQTGEHGNRQRE